VTGLEGSILPVIGETEDFLGTCVNSFIPFKVTEAEMIIKVVAVLRPPAARNANLRNSFS
jgi:hypothetical protein